MEYDLGRIKIHTPIKVRRVAYFNGERVSKIINTTMGRLLSTSLSHRTWVLLTEPRGKMYAI